MTLFFGYLNHKSFGDNLLLEICSKAYRNWDTLSSEDNLLKHLQKILQNKEIILLGGLFQDQTSIRSNFYYLLVVLYAKLLGKRVEFRATGLGPFRSKISKMVTLLAYKLANQISVRDQFSSNFLTRHRIKHNLVDDLVFSFKYDQSLVDIRKIPKAKFDLISINPNLQKIDTEGKLEIICQADQEPSAAKFIYTKDYNAHEIYYIIKNCSKSLITQRFHIAVLARLAGIVFSTSPDCHKVLSLFE